MKKSSFAATILGTVGSLIFGLGMCMCLLPEWNMGNKGVITGCIGLFVLLITVIVWRKMEKKDPIKISGKTIGAALIGISGLLLLGIGMCLCMLWSQLVIGTIAGIAGIIVLLCLIPFIKGLK